MKTRKRAGVIEERADKKYVERAGIYPLFVL